METLSPIIIHSSLILVGIVLIVERHPLTGIFILLINTAYLGIQATGLINQILK